MQGKYLAIGGGALALGLVAAGAWWFVSSAPPVVQRPAGTPVVTASGDDEFLSGAVTLAVHEDTEVRDFPSVSGGAAVRQLTEGNMVTGRWVRGADVNARWLRLSGGGYVYGPMLRAPAPPPTETASGGPPITLAISNRNCEWGSDLRPYFDQSIAARERLAAASPDGIAPEDSTSFIAVPNRPWRGLTVTAVAIHWESSSVYFREPVERVREVLRANGIEVSDLGEMPIRNEEAVEGQSLDPTNAEDRRWGASGITCGV
jgi:hypothetical protein